MEWFSKLLNTSKPTIFLGDFNWELLFPATVSTVSTDTLVNIKECTQYSAAT
jgi:hypothetical protein